MDLNRQLSREVYKVEDNNLKVHDIVEETNELVLDTIDTYKDTLNNETYPRKNGMQAMVTATIKDKYKMKDIKKLKEVPGYPESVITNHITITYAGTNLTSGEDIYADSNEILLKKTKTRGVFYSALAYADEVEKKYPKEKGYKISVTGHSLGGSEAIYVAALRGYDAFTYGAAGTGLTQKQIDDAKGLIVNIYDTSDIVTSGLIARGQYRLPFYSFGIDNAGWQTFGHSLDQFHTDALGNYIDQYGHRIVYSDGKGGIDLKHSLLAQDISKNEEQINHIRHARHLYFNGTTKVMQLYQENKWIRAYLQQFDRLTDLRVSLMASGGGLSSSERIYLDDVQALAAVELAASRFDDAITETIDIYRQGIRQLEEEWSAGLREMNQLAPSLSDWEIEEAMTSQGCTRELMVHDPTEDFQNKINRAQQIQEEFSRLTHEIKNKIHELVQRDQDLANQIRGALS